MASVGLEIVTPTGLAFEADGLSAVVLRRRETRFEVGSEVVILPRHGPMLIRLPDHVIECRRGDSAQLIGVKSGFAEVLDDRISVLTRSVEKVDEPPPRCRGQKGSPGTSPA